MIEFLRSLRRLPIIILAALVVILSGCLSLGQQSTSTPTVDLPVAPVTGARAPDLTLADLNGDEVSLSYFRGKPVLLNFWATW